MCYRKALLNKPPKSAADSIAVADHRQRYVEEFRRLRAQEPDMPIDELEKLATAIIVSKAPKSRAFYRIQATHKLMGAGEVGNKRTRLMPSANSKDDAIFMPEKPKVVSAQ